MLGITGCGKGADTGMGSAGNAAVSEPAEQEPEIEVPELFVMDRPEFAGVVDGDAYINEYFGVRSDAPEDYRFLTDQTIKFLGYWSMDLFNNSDSPDADDIVEYIKSGKNFMACVLADSSYDNSLTVSITGIDPSFSQDDAEYIIDAIIPSQIEYMGAIGGTNVTCERSVTTFLGEEMPCMNLDFDYESNGTTLEMRMVQVILVKDGYAATITAQAGTDESVATLLDSFSVIE